MKNVLAKYSLISESLLEEKALNINRMSQDHKRVGKIIDAIETQKKFEDFTTQVTPRTPEELEAMGPSTYSNEGTNEGQSKR